MNILMYFIHAGWVVKAIMLILVVASFASWTLIFQRASFFKRKLEEADQFEKRFAACSDLSHLYVALDNHPQQREGMASLFYSGFKELIRMKKQGDVQLRPIERAMQIRQAKEAESCEAYLPFFASLGSIAPFIGLFATVWGIMASLQALGQAQQATIGMVAPGISEALVATALGLFTAIPAAIAYNRYATQATRLLDRLDLFQEEFIALIDEERGRDKT